MNDFSQNTSAFNCGLITFKKLDMVESHLHGLHGNNRIVLVTDDSCL